MPLASSRTPPWWPRNRTNPCPPPGAARNQDGVTHVIDIDRQDNYSGGAVAVTATAGIVMMLVGILHGMQGLVALLNDEFYLVGNEYAFQFDLTAWGWIHLIAGVVFVFAGFGLFTGAVWARTVAVILACISIVANFAWMPYYPCGA